MLGLLVHTLPEMILSSH